MPVLISGADLQLASSHNAHRRLSEDEILTPAIRNSPDADADLDDEEYVKNIYGDQALKEDGALRKKGWRKWPRRGMNFLIRHGVESRGIEPVPRSERVELKWWTVIPQCTLWAAANTNILTFSAGTLGPLLFGLDLKSCIWTIVLFGGISTIPVAYFATFGPVLGMRQMVQARYYFGYYPALIPAFGNVLTLLGFLAVNAILGGQTLSLASGGAISWNVGIVVVSVISLLLSFLGLRALHFYSMALFPVMLIVYFVLVGVTAKELHLALEVVEGLEVTSGQILSFGALLIGFTIPYATLASDFTTYLPHDVNKYGLFAMVFFGLFIPITLIQIFAAAVQLAAQSVPAWTEASETSPAALLFAISGSSGPAKLVMVLMMFSVTGNIAPTVYSCGLSAVVMVPWLARVPRYFLAVGVTAVYLPLGIVGADHFYVALQNFLAILAYWFALFLPPALLESSVVRRPLGLETFPVGDYDQPGRLPMGWAAVGSGLLGVPLIVAGMYQVYWTGWIAKLIPGEGDIAFESAIVVVAIAYLPLRYLERRITGR